MVEFECPIGSLVWSVSSGNRHRADSRFSFLLADFIKLVQNGHRIRRLRNKQIGIK